jgi:hypothetical protein
MFDESLDVAVAKLVAGLYAVPDAHLPALQRTERLQRTKWLLTALVATVVTAAALLILASYALSQRTEARRQRDQANAERNIAVARLLASEGYRVSAVEPGRARAFFLASLDVHTTPNAVSGLLSLVKSDPHANMRFLTLDAVPSALHVREDGRIAIGQRDGDIVLWQAGERAASMGERSLSGTVTTTRLRGIGARIIALTQVGDRVTAIDSAGRVVEWTPAVSSPRTLATLTSPEAISRKLYDRSFEAVISGNGEAAAVPTYSGIAVWRRSGGVLQVTRSDMGAGGPIALTPDGLRLLYPVAGPASDRISVRIVPLDSTSRATTDVPALPNGAGMVLSSVFAGGGAHLAMGTQNGFVFVWRMGDTLAIERRLQHRVVPQMGAYEVVEHVHIDDDGRTLVSRFGGAWHLWDLATGTQLGAPSVTASSVAAYSSALRALVAVEDRTVLVTPHGVDELRYIACLSTVLEIPDQEWQELAPGIPKTRPCKGS